MAQKVKLFQKLTIENLMLHEHTVVNLAKESITLITGANGSGKTQILDGLILCLGHIPARAKAKGIGSFVGKNNENTKITLELANPITNNQRSIRTMDQDLNSVINADIIKITVKISRKESSTTYYLNNSRKIVRGRLVTRRDIRRIFDSIGVRGDNKLAFTGEGTVDEFASKSPKRKLDVLLEVTGLKEYREQVIASQETLRNSIQEIEPLKRKYETESKLLNLWSDAMKILNQKKKLMIMKKKIETELEWSFVNRLEKQIAKVNVERTKILKQRSDNETAINEKENEIMTTNKRIRVLNDELTLVEDQESSKNRRLIAVESQISNEQENITNFRKEINRYIEQKEKIEKILKTKDLTEKDKQLQDKQKQLTKRTKELSQIQEKFVKTEKELIKQRKKVIAEPDFDDLAIEGDIYAGEKLTRYERGLVTASKIFYHKIKQKNLDEEIIGPIISLIRINENHKSWEKATRNLIGRNLFAFIAKNDEAYRYAKRLYDETWPNWKPALSVYKITTDDAKKSDAVIKKPSYKEIHAVASNLIEGNPFAKALIKQVVKGVLSEDKYDPNILTKIAKESKVNVLTKSGKSYYLSYGGFGRPPAPMKTALGWKIKASDGKVLYGAIDERKVRSSIVRYEKDLRDLKMDEIKLLKDISLLHQEIQSLGLPDEKLLGKIETINEIIAVIETKIAECRIHQDKLRVDLTEMSDDYDTYASKKLDVKHRIRDTQEVKDYLKIDLHSLKEKSSRLLTLELNYDSEYETLYSEKAEKEKLARVLGERPEEIRNYNEIRDELNRVTGHLESIGISDVDEEKIAAQKIKVESLKTYMKEREEHINNLRADLEARLAFWSGELQDIITDITKSMKLLLSGIFERIKLKVTSITKPEEAGLFIEAITKGEAYRDFRELSGGEKVLAIEGLILAMHTLTDSPIHAIDEFTQRLDDKNKALAFSIAVRTQKLAGENSRFVPQFILLCPDALNVELLDEINHLVVSEMKVVKAEAIK
ncbi:MAG: AAA family ATPase [Asgard group archaeon]|nr:AAA family ATPase [Asgard group archaeon]